MSSDPVVGFLLTKLSELITNEINLVGGADEKVKSLHSELQWISAFLRDADAKYNQDKRIKCWVDDVRDLAYDVEDAIDTFLFKMERKQYIAGVSSLRRLKAKRKLSKRIDRINRRIVDINQRKSTYGIENLSSQAEGTSAARPSSWTGSRDPRRTSYLEDDVKLVGVGEVVNSLVSRLIGGDSDLSFVSIVGMGGLGKTTVAKKIYNRVDVRRHFDSCHAWASVSQEYNRRELLKVLLKQLMELPREEMEKLNEEEEVVEKLWGVLKEKKYLIVLDDVWKIEALDDLKFAFPDMKNGSRIILTTRYKDVALHAQSRNPPPYDMRFLTDDESWELFLKKTFPSENGVAICCPENLVSLGKDIVKKCGGLPLAIIVIGGLLSTKLGNAPDSWDKVHRSRLWELREGPRQIETILSLSYNDLPYELKLCFLYCGMYPEDYDFYAERLIGKWVAEGFLQEREEESMEEVGEDLLEQLISRSMVQGAQRYETVRACRLHDLLRDLAISEAKKCNFFHIYSNKDSFCPARVVRRCITYDDNIVNCVKSKQAARHLRSFLSMGEVSQLPPNAVRNFVGGFQLLRVLDLRNVSMVRWPEKIVELIHLRFFSVRCERLDSIPVSITNLRYLQTLDLWEPETIGRLPIEMGGMQHLRHLIFHKGCMPKILGINHLRNLQTLVSVDAADGSWIKDELQFFTNLRNLGLKNLSRTHMTDLYHSLGKLNHLHYLRLQGDPCPTPVLSHCLRLKELILVGTLEKLPELHHFPPNLTRILLDKSELRVDPFTTLEGLPTLGCLELWRNAYIGKEMRCSAGGFPQLERLELMELDELEKLSVEKGGMPNLRHLEFMSCPRLEMPLLHGSENMTLTHEFKYVGNFRHSPFYVQRPLTFNLTYFLKKVW